MKHIKLFVLPVLLSLVLLLATPAMAAEEFFSEPEERSTQYADYGSVVKSAVSDADLERFTELFLEKASTCPQYVDISSLKLPAGEDVMNQVRDHIFYETPEAFHCYSIGFSYNSRYLTKVYIAEYYSYSDTAEEYAVCLEQIQVAADRMLEDIRDNDSLTDVQKALLLHDRLALWTEYDYNIASGNLKEYPDWDFTAYGALGTRVAVCQGYTMAYMYLLDRVGIKNVYCSSSALNHAWNIVYIDNKPYHVDVTWDDELYIGGVQHNNFLLSTAGMVNSGHRANDYNDAPVDTTYDSAFWQNSNAAFLYFEGNLYYHDEKADMIKMIQGTQVTDILPVGEWRENTRLGMVNDWILYSTYMQVSAYNLTSGETKLIFDLPRTVTGSKWIEGFECMDDGTVKIEFLLMDADYNYSSDYLMVDVELPAATAKNGWYDGFYYENDQLVTNAWRQDQTGWFHLPANGSLSVSQLLSKDGQWCYVGTDGYCVKNQWIYDETGWCYLNAEGYMVTSVWVEYDGKTYYCDEEGYRVTGSYIIDGVTYLFGADGVLLKEDSMAILSHPVDATVDSGETVNFSVTTTGKVKSYRWQYRKVYKWFDTAMTGYDTDTLTVVAQGSRDGYSYRCMVTFADGTVQYSEPAKLLVNTFITITAAPNDQVVVLGFRGQFTVEAYGEGLTYQWQYKRPGSELWIDTAMEGATRPTVMIETTTSRDGYQYRCKITDVAGKIAYSNAATMSVLSFKSHPVDVFATTGDTVQFAVTTSVSNGFTYQWQYRRSEKGAWSNTTLTGYNTAILSVPAKSKNGYQYRCVITGAKTSKLESKVATLHHGNPVVITSQTEKVTAAVGQTAEFTVNATNAYSYQWYYCSSKTGTTWIKTAMDGCDTPNLQVPVTAGRNGYKYRCEIKGLDGKTYYSQPAILSVNK